jgi:hypothetical protein
MNRVRQEGGPAASWLDILDPTAGLKPRKRRRFLRAEPVGETKSARGTKSDRVRNHSQRRTATPHSCSGRPPSVATNHA